MRDSMVYVFRFLREGVRVFMLPLTRFEGRGSG